MSTEKEKQMEDSKKKNIKTKTKHNTSHILILVTYVFREDPQQQHHT